VISWSLKVCFHVHLVPLHCGDLESWAEGGCCKVHAPRATTSADPTANKTLPPGPRRDAAVGLGHSLFTTSFCTVETRFN
jgi:hypothetical protein